MVLKMTFFEKYIGDYRIEIVKISGGYKLNAYDKDENIAMPPLKLTKHFWAKRKTMQNVVEELASSEIIKIDINHTKRDIVKKSDELAMEIEKYCKKEYEDYKEDEEKEESNPELERKTIEFLRNGEIMNKIKDILDEDIIGEEHNKLLLYLISLSTKTENTMSSIVTGESSVGKSYMADNVLKLFPEDMLIDYSRVTKSVIDRIGKDVDGTIFYVKELQGAEDAAETLRVWISEKKLKLLTNTKDENGNVVTEEIETKGAPSFLSTTAEIKIEQQLGTRVWIISLDETEYQTKNILKFISKRAVTPFEDKENEFLKVVRNIPKMLEKHKVIIPYADKIDFPADRVAARRNFKKIVDLIRVIAFLHQYQRPMLIVDDESYIIATKTDFNIATKIIEKNLRATTAGVPDSCLEVLNEIKDLEDDLTNRKISQITGKAQGTIRRIMSQLFQSGFVISERKGRENHYSIVKSPKEVFQSVRNSLDGWVDSVEIGNYLNDMCSRVQVRVGGVERRIKLLLNGTKYPITLFNTIEEELKEIMENSIKDYTLSLHSTEQVNTSESGKETAPFGVVEKQKVLGTLCNSLDNSFSNMKDGKTSKKTPKKTPKKEQIFSMLPEDSEISIFDIEQKLEKEGVDLEIFEKALHKLKQEKMVFEPRPGFLKRL